MFIFCLVFFVFVFLPFNFVFMRFHSFFVFSVFCDLQVCLVVYDRTICIQTKIVSLKERKSECSPCFVTLFETRGGAFRVLLLPPCQPALTATQKGRQGGLLEGSCGRRRCRVMRNRLNVSKYAPASEHETLIRRRCRKQIDCTYDDR